MRCFVVAGLLLTSASRGPSAIAELLVYNGPYGGVTYGSSLAAMVVYGLKPQLRNTGCVLS